MSESKIVRVAAREILDSRGTPTVEAEVVLADGSVGVCSVPSGASTGIYEAHELRDNDSKRYGGRGVLNAVDHVNRIIAPELMGISALEQAEIDRRMIELDGSDNKSKLGANAILSVSLAAAKAAAMSRRLPLYTYVGEGKGTRLPIPMMNILNGGAHASNNINIQEFMIVPVGLPTFSEALRAGSEIYHTLGTLLKKRHLSTGVGDEGGFAPDLDSDEAAIELICNAVELAGYSTDNVKIALDVAAGEWYDNGIYKQYKTGNTYTLEDLIDYYTALAEKYPLMSLEDGLDQRDFEGWSQLTEKLGDKVMLVGDDLFVTSTKRLKEGIARKAGNAILIKPNQIGTLSEVVDVIGVARGASFNYVMSHRSGETEDTTISDLAVGLGAPYIKTGAPCRSERVAKYNRLLRIEEELGKRAIYSGQII
ncbi:MAG: phosphopyruvate hydratase [Clostridiales bacterium]|nr:phosphopyruvate hydratase [Clostridiales bacterium]